jgi:mevalonate kinase
VEEDRYIREQEKAFFEKRKAELAASEHEEYKQKIAPAMAEAQEALKKLGENISDKGLEALARWKLGL